MTLLQCVQEAPPPLFFHVTISAILSFPHKLHWGCSSPARCQTAAPDLHRYRSLKSRWFLLREWMACVKHQWHRWSRSAGCQQISKQNVTLLVYLVWCWTSVAVFLFPSPSYSYHPSCFPLQSTSSPNLDTTCCELDEAAGGVCSHPESQLCDCLDVLATKLSICEYSKHAARPVLLSTLKTRNVSSSFCCHWISVIERWAVLSIPLFTVLCINYRKGIQNIAEVSLMAFRNLNTWKQTLDFVLYIILTSCDLALYKPGYLIDFLNENCLVV